MTEPPRAPGLGAPRVLAALVAGQLGLHSAMAGLRMAAALQALRDGHDAWAVGLLVALFAAAPVLLALHAGRLADRLGYHRPMRMAATLVLVGVGLAVAAALAPQGWTRFALLGLAAMLTGSGANMGSLTTQRTAGVTARDSVERMRVFSWLGIAPAFANVVGPVAAGFMIDHGGFGPAYGVLMALPLLTLAAPRAVPPVAPRRTPTAGPGAALDLLAAPGFKRLLLVNWMTSTCWDVHSFAVPILGHEYGFAAGTIGLVLGSFTLAVTGVRLLVPLIAHRLDEITVLRAAMSACGAVLLIYPLARSPLAMGTCAVLLGLTLGGTQPMVMSTLHHLTPGDRHGEALALRSMAINASSSLMPLLFGALGTVVGAAALFWGVGAMVAAGARVARGLRPSG